MSIQDTALGKLRVATFFLYSATGSTAPLISLYMSHRGLTPLQVGQVVSLSTLVSILPIVTMGRVSDLLGRERIQVVVGFILVALAPLHIAARNFIDFLLLQLAYSSLVWVYAPLSDAIAMDHMRDSRGKGFGRYRAFGAVGWVLGTFLGGVMSDRLGFYAAFLSSSLFFLVSVTLNAINALSLRHRILEKIPKIEGKTAMNRRAYTLLVTSFIASLTTPAYYTFLPLFMENRFSTSKLYSSLAFTITPIAEVPAMIYLGALSDRVGRVRIITLCLAAFPLRYLLTMSLDDPLLVIGVQLFHGLTWGGLYVVSTTYLSETTPKESRGFILSLYTVSMSLGGVVGGYLLGLLVEELGFYTMYTFAAIVSSLSIPIFYILKTLERSIE